MKRKMLACVLTVLMLMNLSSGISCADTPDSNDWDGCFQIYNYTDLLTFAKRVNDGETALDGVLMNDITIEYGNKELWNPIGEKSECAYNGTFFGNHKVIRGLTNENSTLKIPCIGFFGYIGAEGSVKDLSILDVGFTAFITDEETALRVYAACVVGCNFGIVENVSVADESQVRIMNQGSTKQADVSVYAGGIAGYNGGSGIIRNCSFEGETSVSADSVNDNSEVQNYSCAGALTGYNEGTLEYCRSDASGKIMVTAQHGAYAGGLVGYNCIGASISNCENHGSVNVQTLNIVSDNRIFSAGGIAACNNGNITKTFFTGNGRIETRVLIPYNCEYYLGAFVGWNGSDGVIEHCANSGAATVVSEGNKGTVCAGGFSGYNQGAVRSSYYSGTGNVTAIPSTNADSEFASYAGGFAGKNQGEKAEIVNCCCGGSSAIAAVTASGGLAGYNAGTLQSAYYSGGGTISAADAGGVIGWDEGTAANCYYDMNVCRNPSEAIGKTKDGKADVATVSGLTTVQMTGLTAIGSSGMDFTDTAAWLVRDSYHSDGLDRAYYPHLRGFAYDTTGDVLDWPNHTEYRIGSYEGLKRFAELVNGGDFSANAVLSENILIPEGDCWVPIGGQPTEQDGSVVYGEYKGHFDGVGHTITGLVCTADLTSKPGRNVYIGLFGVIGKEGVVQRIGLIDADITARGSGNAENPVEICAGALAGYSRGTIDQCLLSGNGTIEAEGFSVQPGSVDVSAGAFAGFNGGTIRNSSCSGNTDVQALVSPAGSHVIFWEKKGDRAFTGGFAGRNSGMLSACSCSNTGAITATPDRITFSTDGNELRIVKTIDSYVGAIVGANDGEVSECNCDVTQQEATKSTFTLSWDVGELSTYTFGNISVEEGENSVTVFDFDLGTEIVMDAYSTPVDVSVRWYQYDAGGEVINRFMNDTISFTADETEAHWRVNFTDDRQMPLFVSHAVVLTGTIGLCFYMDLPDDIGVKYENSYMTFSIPHGTCTPRVNYADSAEHVSEIRRGFVCFVNAIQMAEPISATFHYRQEGKDKTITLTYSVKEYIDKFEVDRKGYDFRPDESTIELVHALADYGHYVQPFLSMVRNWKLGTDYARMDRHFIEAQDFNFNNIRADVQINKLAYEDNTCGDITEVRQSLTLDSETAINLYFKLSEEYHGTFEAYLYTRNPWVGVSTWEQMEYTIGDDGRYRITISGIAAQELDAPYKVRVKTAEEHEMNIQVAAWSYLYSAIEHYTGTTESDIAARNAMAALWHYSSAAEGYEWEHSKDTYEFE